MPQYHHIGTRKRTPEQRLKAWEKFHDSRLRWYQAMYERSNPEVRALLMAFSVLEFEGEHIPKGEAIATGCPKCGEVWAKKEIKGYGAYYVPTCECFIKCPACKRYLYDVQALWGKKLTRCDNCGFHLYNEEGSARYGEGYDKYMSDIEKTNPKRWMFEFSKRPGKPEKKKEKKSDD